MDEIVKPTVGRIVHYQAFGTPGGEFPSVPRAAIVTEVGHSGIEENFEATTEVGLCVMNPTGLFLNRGVPYSADGKPGTWRWPPRA